VWSLLCSFNLISCWACQDQTSGCCCSTQCLLNCQLPTRKKRLRRSKQRWKDREGARFVSHSLAVTRRQKGLCCCRASMSTKRRGLPHALVGMYYPVATSCHGQGYHPLDQAAQGPIQLSQQSTILGEECCSHVQASLFWSEAILHNFKHTELLPVVLDKLPFLNPGIQGRLRL